MKKYNTLGELLIDFRKHRKMSQLDFAALLDIDARTVIRWEKNESLIKVQKEKYLIENLGIPHQVIRNLNTDKPIAIYFDFERWAYSLSFLSSRVLCTSEFKTKTQYDTDRIHTITEKGDLEFISYIQQNQENCQPIQERVIREAAKILPELNLVIYSPSGFHAGHISILPLKYSSYIKLRDEGMEESDLNTGDLNHNLTDEPFVFFYYSLYANSLDNTYYLMNRLLSFFRTKKGANYILAGISYRKMKVDLFQEMGMKIVWEKPFGGDGTRIAFFLAGNLDEYLFEKGAM